MTPLPESDILSELLPALTDGHLTAEQFARLEALLRDDPAAQAYYRRYMRLCALLEFQRAAEQGDVSSTPSSDIECPVVPIVIDTNSPAAPLASPFSASVGGWLLSYAAAVAIVGVAILSAWLFNVSWRGEIAKQPPPAVSPRSPNPQYVADITATAECQWADMVTNPAVPLHGRYHVRSGWVEITYHSGARVVLEGPCVYEVDSDRGGFLSLGRLTARVGESGEARGEKARQVSSQKSASGVPSPLSPLTSPLFSVRTPTAIVTDLGTEFGVEVDKLGGATAHVLQGKIEVQPLGNDSRSANGRKATSQGEPIGPAVPLIAGESVRLAKRADGIAPTPVRGRADATAFPVRPGHLADVLREQRAKAYERWQATRERLRQDPSLVAYYTFETRGRDPTRDMSILPNVAATGEALDGRIEGARWTQGRFPGKYALRFSGPGYQDRVELPDAPRLHLTGPFTVAVWFNRGRFGPEAQTLISDAGNGWRIGRPSRIPNLDAIGFYTSIDDRHVHECIGPGKTPDGQWHLVTAVWSPVGDKAIKRLYLDGRLDAEGQPSAPLYRAGGPLWLGNESTLPGNGWEGAIDEVAILSRALSGEEIKQLYLSGRPQGAVPSSVADGAHKSGAPADAIGANRSPSSQSVPGGVVFSDREAFNAVVSSPAVLRFSGYVEAGSYKSVNELAGDGISVVSACDSADNGLWLINSAWGFTGTGREVVAVNSAFDATMTFPAGTTAVGMRLYSLGNMAKFTVTYSDGTARDFLTPVLNSPVGMSSPSFWGIVSTKPGVVISSIKICKAEGNKPWTSPYLEMVTAGKFAAPGRTGPRMLEDNQRDGGRINR
ncbi:MAG: LamG-like jellyroll fold domain-containing protein [Thermoguttaceae bacterium]